MLHHCHEGKNTKFLFKGNKLYCGGKSLANILKYTKIIDIIDDLKAQRQDFAKKYFKMLNDILLGKDVNPKEFDQIVARIADIDSKCDELYDKQLSPFVEQRNLLQEKYNNVFDEQNAIINFQSPLNPEVAKKIVESMKQKQKLLKELSQVSQKDFEEYTVDSNTHIVDKIDVQQTPSPSPLKKQTNTLSTEQKTKIKSNIKNVLKNVFRFKDKEQCLSKARSKEYFMTKDDIIKTINENPDLKKLMPTNFKNLSKEQLCTFIFDTKQ